MDNRVARQTMRLAQKTASLKILYDVAAGINQIQELDELLLRFLRVLKEMVNGRAATLRLATPEGAQRLVGAIGLDDRLLREEEMRPLDLCLCGTALSPGDILCDHPDRHCERAFGRRMFASDTVDVVRVPLGYHDQVLGAFSLFVQKPGVSEREDILELLATIGHHLGMAVAKQRSDQEAKRLSILQERNALAHELHDSLAQTLASLRFQVRLLDESLREGPISDAARRDLQRIQTGLDQAHRELRDLLSSFRAPIDQRGLVLALEQLVRRFGQETGLYVLLQNDCRQIPLAAATEMQLLRVVQEALTNVRKHAQAHTVRVLLTCRSDGALLLLVEDDGVGFRAPVSAGRPGERLGLAIMEERARRMGAELRIESEPGEGTRVELTLEIRPRSAPLAQRLAG
jgi:two-component system nitrate/nitrite sensor histidine kinase NarX